MARSRPSPVAVTEPGLVLRWVPAILTPRPIWNGLVPPETVEGAEPSPRLRLNTVENTSRLLLYAVVLTLAMLLPMTSMFRELAVRPDRPVNIAVVEGMGGVLSPSPEHQDASTNVGVRAPWSHG